MLTPCEPWTGLVFIFLLLQFLKVRDVLKILNRHYLIVLLWLKDYIPTEFFFVVVYTLSFEIRNSSQKLVSKESGDMKLIRNLAFSSNVFCFLYNNKDTED